MAMMSKVEWIRRLDARGVLLAVGAVILIRIVVKFLSKSKKRMPGPFFHMPVLGNLSLVGPLPHQSFYHLSKKYGDIFSLKLGLSYTVVISSPELAREVLRDQDLTFASRPPNVAAEILMYGTKDIAWAPYSDHWRHMRKVCVLELFTVKRIESFKNVRAEEVQDLVHRVYETCKVSTDDLHPTPIHFDFRRCSANLIVTSWIVERVGITFFSTSPSSASSPSRMSAKRSP
jgi:hypothetical protein